MRHILMLSSSRAADEPYLEHAKPMIAEHLGDIVDVVFIPYAGVTMMLDEYTEKVQQALPSLNVKGLHEYADPKSAISNAKAVLVGGGNTFHLLYQLYAFELITLIQQRVNTGMPYIGWSAGSNICGETIRTTNDMPIIEPPSFNALHFLAAQINPHYTDYQPPGHNGETRDQRLAEFTQLNPKTPVLAIREGTALLLSGDNLSLKGQLGGFVFLGSDKHPIAAGDDLKQYLGV
ncbi:dipeptidase PepE [Alteromonas oceanisediminis]|uniref:dipeptidase PepE n=1 Tax=Alteromonas oceanisediminis TaxID=2836180 RepID=UPI001BDB5480|nr:dipeptidase PepE [Alteromonas oceanisediminis]MBT0587633.1 dipeptidase PepE [Alteromonas oceanisediminis]